jgi:hypothetical protein
MPQLDCFATVLPALVGRLPAFDMPAVLIRDAERAVVFVFFMAALYVNGC